MEEFTCDNCEETFIKKWTDKEARKEAEELWTPAEMSEGKEAIVCDDCFNEMMKYQNQFLKERYAKD